MSEDLIKRSDAIKDLCDISNNSDMPNDWHRGMSVAISALYRVPSADRPQGKWIKFGLGRGTRILFCTNCERRIEMPLSQGDSNYDYCPNCGARMKGADDE